MSLKDQLKEDMKAAMKAREEGKTALSVMQKSMIKWSLMIMVFLAFWRKK